MRAVKLSVRVLLLILLAACLLPAAEFQAGFGRGRITPDGPIMLSGYAARTHPSEGVAHDLWAKAIVIEDAKGGRFALITVDLESFPRMLADEVALRVTRLYGIPRERVILNCAHDHSAPEIIEDIRTLDAPRTGEARKIAEYTRKVMDQMVEAMGAATRDLAPARLAVGHGKAGFGGNRRQSTPGGIKLRYNPDGPTDHDVPVIEVTDANGKLRGVIFGYACHNTTLPQESYIVAGDYAGYAQVNFEERHPGTTAMFLQLCAGDQDPYPRGTLALAQQHGKELAEAVDTVVSGKTKRSLHPPLRFASETTELKFAPFTRDTFTARLNDPDRWIAAHSKQMLAALDAGTIEKSMPYRLWVARFGKDLTVFFLEDEVLVEYGIRAKKEFPGEDTVIAAYSNDIRCYIPTAQALKAGGYEPVDSVFYTDLPGPFDLSIEDSILAAMRKALKQVGR